MQVAKPGVTEYKCFFREIEFGDIGHGHRLAVGVILRTVNAQLQLYYDRKWKDKLEDEFARRGQDAGGNKLTPERPMGHICPMFFSCICYMNITKKTILNSRQFYFR